MLTSAASLSAFISFPTPSHLIYHTHFLTHSYAPPQMIRIYCITPGAKSFTPLPFIIPFHPSHLMSNSRKLQITIVSRQAGQAIDQVISDVLATIFKTNHPQPMEVQHPSLFDNLNSNLDQKYYHSYDVHQVRCYQQHVGNFCGYHASFAYVCILQILENVKDAYQLNDGVSFWTFKKKIQAFLFQYRKTKKLDKTAWPWRDEDILYGDFQRTYNQVLKNNPNTLLGFTTHEAFELLESNWEFQYRNLVCDQPSRLKLGEKIEYFVNYKKSKPLIFVMMLGITNHWTCFIAAKVKNATQFWFIDSKNREFLDFSVTEISVLINALELKRIEDKLPAWQKYQKDIYEQAMVDTQLSLKLIVQLLKGEENIHRYHYNRLFEIFGEKYEQFMNESQESFVSNLGNWTTDYKHNMRAFFINKVDVGSLYESNRVTYRHMVRSIVRYEKEARDVGIIANYIKGGGNL